MVRALFAVSTVLAVLAALVPDAQAQGKDPYQGRNLAAACANCHGTDGAALPGMAVLAGRPAATLEQQMQDFKAGRRPATIMHQIARGYSNEQIGTLAAYFSALKPR